MPTASLARHRMKLFFPGSNSMDNSTSMRSRTMVFLTVVQFRNNPGSEPQRDMEYSMVLPSTPLPAPSDIVIPHSTSSSSNISSSCGTGSLKVTGLRSMFTGRGWLCTGPFPAISVMRHRTAFSLPSSNVTSALAYILTGLPPMPSDLISYSMPSLVQGE